MAKYRKYVTVSVDGGTEKLVPALISTQVEPKVVDAIVVGTGGDNIDVLVYVEREKIVDYPVDLLSTMERIIDLGIQLPVGQQLYVGFRNKGTTTISADIGVIYEIGAR